jgi:hypothetical protein
MRRLLRVLEVLSVLELASIAALFGNLLTVHLPGLASALGPVHGTLYLAVAVTALLGRGLLLRTRLLALVPLLGGAFTLANVRRERARAAGDPETGEPTTAAGDAEAGGADAARRSDPASRGTRCRGESTPRDI